jgi:Domain of unknown function (DUF4169)
MPADILSLSKARKTKARDAKEKLAVQNRIIFGRTAIQKQTEKAQKERFYTLLDGAKREPNDMMKLPLKPQISKDEPH